MQPTAPTPAHIQAQGWRERTLPGFIVHVGPLWTRKESDGWAYGLQVGPQHLNPAQMVHGGLLMTLLDHALSAIAWEAMNRRPCVTVQMDTQFLSAAREGQFLEARGQVVRAAGSLVFMRGQIDADGSTLIAGSAVLKALGDAARPDP